MSSATKQKMPVWKPIHTRFCQQIGSGTCIYVSLGCGWLHWCDTVWLAGQRATRVKQTGLAFICLSLTVTQSQKRLQHQRCHSLHQLPLLSKAHMHNQKLNRPRTQLLPGFQDLHFRIQAGSVPATATAHIQNGLPLHQLDEKQFAD